MSRFDDLAFNWDLDKIHLERSTAIATYINKMIPILPSMKAMEYGAGTGLLSFLLRDKLADIILMDNSREMIKVSKEEAAYLKARNVHPVFYDLEQKDYSGKFDLIYNQMVLHHVKNVDFILSKFYSLLKPGGFLAIADLFSEDGSFHGEDVDVHKGFDPGQLASALKGMGFSESEFTKCYEIKREDKTFPIFILVTQKQK